MKKIIISIAILLCVNNAQAQFLGPCTNSYIYTDSSRSFIISEIKPYGQNQFVELWNCKDSDYEIPKLFLISKNQKVIDSLINITLPAQSFTLITLVQDSFQEGEIHIGIRNDTILYDEYALAFSLIHPEKSISFCDWYRETVPSPGQYNYCETSDILELLNDDQILKEVQQQKCWDIFGSPIDCTIRNRVIIKKIYYTDQSVRMYKMILLD